MAEIRQTDCRTGWQVLEGGRVVGTYRRRESAVAHRDAANEATPIADDSSGTYHVHVTDAAGDEVRRYAVQAADGDDARAYVQLVCIPVDHPGAVVANVRQVRHG